jgi:transmembrane sensor
MDFDPSVDWNRLVRYLTGESAPEEGERTRDWILESRKRARLMDELRKVWAATEHSPRSRDVEAAWEEISREIAFTEGREDVEEDITDRPDVETSSNHRATEHRKRSSWNPLLRDFQVSTGVTVLVAAVLLATAITAYLASDFSASIGQGSAPKVFKTKPGQRATVRLADGSKVRLNAESRLEVTAGFGDQNRTVRLSGEAYFEVAQDTTTSFVVQAGGIRATALGTAFNVEAYTGANKQEIAVTEGVISLESGKESIRDTVHLRADYLGMVYGSHLQTLRDNAAVHRRTAWTKGQLVFSDTDFDEVTRRLERWYDVEIDSRIDPEEVDRLNASFHEESLGEVLEAISTALDLMYRQEENTVVFYRRS